MKAVSKKLGAEYVTQVKPVMGGEDFSQYGRTEEKIPSVLFWVGAVEPSKYAKAKADGMPLPSLHSSLFAPDYARTIQTGSDAMTAAALELFKD
jgi:hippurate hydrolase